MTTLVKYDPRVEGAALALLDKMLTALGVASTVVAAKEIHTMAKVAQERALSLPTYNRASGLIFAAEVAIGQMLLKEKAPAQGGRPKTDRTTLSVKEPTLQEILGARNKQAANDMAAAFRKLATLVTVEQLKAAEKLATSHNERLTRKAAMMVVSGTWQKSFGTPAAKKPSKPTDAELWMKLSDATDEQLDALQDLKDSGSKVETLLRYSRAIAGAIRKEKS